MESNKLAVLDRTIPLRAYPKEDLNKILLTSFLTWVSDLLSLTDEASARKLELALPSIREQCIGMGFSEIKKMFEMYVDSKLDIKPIPNYFDRILLGKIVNSYRSRTKKDTKNLEKDFNNEVFTKDYKEKLEINAVIECYNHFQKTRTVDERAFYVYDILDRKGYMPKDIKYKESVKKDAIEILEKEYQNRQASSREENKHFKLVLENLKKGKSSEIKIKCKELALLDFFRKGSNDFKEEYIKQHQIIKN